MILSKLTATLLIVGFLLCCNENPDSQYLCWVGITLLIIAVVKMSYAKRKGLRKF